MITTSDPHCFLSGGYLPKPGSIYMDTSNIGVVVCRDPDSGELVWSIQLARRND